MTEHAGHEMAGHAGHDMAAGGHDKHAGHSVAMFRDKFWLSLALTIPVVLLSHDVSEWFGYTIPMFPGIEYVPAILGTIIFFYGGMVFIRGAQGELADRKPGMMTLISMAIIVAFVTSWAGTLGFFDVEIWWELATLITIMLLGHWLEMRSIAQARGALAALAELLPDTAERVTAAGTEEVALSALAVGDVVLVRPGARVPVDGTVTEGTADVDESMITGESRAVPKEPGDEVTAGTVAAGGSLRVRVTATGDATALSGIMRLVAAAQASGSRAQVLADRAAAILFYVALAAGAITLVFWWLQGDPEGALTRTATVLVIACPHALGLAIPLVIAISTSLGARNGLLVKDRLALERARTVDMVIFDKTGTLTKGEPALVDASDDDALRLAAAVEGDSEHPLARAIVSGAQSRGLDVPQATLFEALPGRGARAQVEGREVRVGGPRLLADLSLAALPVAADWDREGRTVLHVIVDGRVAGVVAVEDEIRPESREAIEALHAQGIRVAMITGDSQAVADAVARRLGIDEVAAQVLPSRQGRCRQGLPIGRSQGRHGRRWRERCPGPGHGRRRHRDRSGNRRGGRERRHRARPKRPPGCRRCHRPVAGHVRQDGPEPRLGDRLQPRGDPGGDGPLHALGHRHLHGRRCHRDERLDDRRGRQCPAATPSPPTARQPPGHQLVVAKSPVFAGRTDRHHRTGSGPPRRHALRSRSSSSHAWSITWCAVRRMRNWIDQVRAGLPSAL